MIYFAICELLLVEKQKTISLIIRILNNILNSKVERASEHIWSAIHSPLSKHQFLQIQGLFFYELNPVSFVFSFFFNGEHISIFVNSRDPGD